MSSAVAGPAPLAPPGRPWRSRSLGFPGCGFPGPRVHSLPVAKGPRDNSRARVLRGDALRVARLEEVWAKARGGL